MTNAPPDLAYALTLKPEEAIRYFESKHLRLTRSWNEMLDADHTYAHTVAHISKLDVLQLIHAELKNAFHEGMTEQEFERRLTALLQAKGWWGKAIDAETGDITQAYPGSNRAVQYGSPARLDLIYRQNLQTAYMAGRYNALSEGRDTHPYWQYVAVMDSRTRPSHAALNGRVFRRDDPAWDSLYPPNGWRCRCRTRPLTDSRLQREGLQVEDSNGKLVDALAPAGRYPDGSPKQAEVTGIRTGKFDADGKEIVLFPDVGHSYHPGTSWQMAQRQYLQASLDSMAGIAPRAALERLKALVLGTEQQASSGTLHDVLKLTPTAPLDDALLQDMAAIAAVNHYASSLNTLIFASIDQGGIKGSAALKHELAETAALSEAGRDIRDTATIAAIQQEFNAAARVTTANAKGLWEIIPYHLHALRAELTYLQAQLKRQGIFEEDLGIIAYAVYWYADDMALKKLDVELLAIDLNIPTQKPPQTLLDALHDR